MIVFVLPGGLSTLIVPLSTLVVLLSALIMPPAYLQQKENQEREHRSHLRAVGVARAKPKLYGKI